VSIEAVEKEKRSKKVVMNIQQNTTDAAHATQVERQVEKKTYTHDTDSEIQANRQGMCVRETEAMIGKAPRLVIHTRDMYYLPHAWNAFNYVSMTLRGIFREREMEIFIFGGTS